MPKLKNRIWGVILFFAYQCARIIFWITKFPVRGAMVAIWHEGRILLVQNSYRKGWSIPGGLVKKVETFAQGAVRETSEEVGILLAEKDLVFVSEVTGELGSRDRSHLFEVVLDHPVEVSIDGWEIINAEFVAPEEALGLALHEHLKGYLRARAD